MAGDEPRINIVAATRSRADNDLDLAPRGSRILRARGRHKQQRRQQPTHREKRGVVTAGQTQRTQSGEESQGQ